MSGRPDDVVADYYEVLGVDSSATTQEIKRAFRRIARECHPDVAGDDRVASERFKKARRAYEQLVDPSRRARYDRSQQPRRNPFQDFWGQDSRGQDSRGRNNGAFSGGRGGPARGPGTGPRNDLDLENLFDDFGGSGAFGFGNGRQQTSREQPRSSAPPPPQPGRDIGVMVRVPFGVAERGGSVEVRYSRLKRSDDGRDRFRYDEICDLRVPPGTRHGDTLRVPRMGDAGTGGGPPGDLVCDIVVEPVSGAARESPPPEDEWPGADRAGSAQAGPGRGAEAGGEPECQPLPISVAEALLGGRVEVPTPAGPVRIVIPPCTSSGQRLRLRGKGAIAPDGQRGDLYLVVEIHTPDSLDAESRELIEAFARLNPDDPRS